jgi:hypothetical protein
LAFSKDLEAYRAAVTWEDAYYNLVRPHKSLPIDALEASDFKWKSRSPAMVAGLTHDIWTVKEQLMTMVLPMRSNPYSGDYRKFQYVIIGSPMAGLQPRLFLGIVDRTRWIMMERKMLFRIRQRTESNSLHFGGFSIVWQSFKNQYDFISTHCGFGYARFCWRPFHQRALSG